MNTNEHQSINKYGQNNMTSTHVSPIKGSYKYIEDLHTYAYRSMKSYLMTEHAQQIEKP